MPNPNLPPQFYSDPTNLLGGMERVAEELGKDRREALELFLPLSINLKNCPTFWSRLDEAWRYEFGHDFDKLGNDTVSGTNQRPKVKWLYHILKTIRTGLSKAQFLLILQRLGDPSVHLSTLHELAPLLFTPEIPF